MEGLKRLLHTHAMAGTMCVHGQIYDCEKDVHSGIIAALRERDLICVRRLLRVPHLTADRLWRATDDFVHYSEWNWEPLVALYE